MVNTVATQQQGPCSLAWDPLCVESACFASCVVSLQVLQLRLIGYVELPENVSVKVSCDFDELVTCPGTWDQLQHNGDL